MCYGNFLSGPLHDLAKILQETWQESYNTSWQFLVWTALHDLAKILQETWQESQDMLQDSCKILKRSCKAVQTRNCQDVLQDSCQVSYKIKARILHDS